MGAHKKQTVYVNIEKTTEKTLQEQLTLIAFSTWAGENASNDVLEKNPANQEYSETVLK